MDDEGAPTHVENPGGTDQVDEVRTLYRHPLAAVGGALMLAGFLTFVILLMVDIGAKAENPYRSIIAFIGAPAVGFIGLLLFLISIRLQVTKARRRGETVRFRLRIEPSDPKYMRSLWLFVTLSGVFLIILAYAGFRGYETTDSTAFCGEACHEVMGPQNVTYQNSPHARVTCAECHIGPGGSFWVRSKIDGIRQVIAVVTNSYDRPIHTPVESLRPAQQTCEECHWPQQFFGDKLITTTYYRTNEQNTPWTINLLVKIGGGNPRTGQLEGIHWHMLSAATVEYVAIDEDRQEIPWFRVTHPDGSVVDYTDPEAEVPDLDDPDTEIRVFDCMDCHNRPSHDFTPPAVAVNLALTKRTLSPDLPYIRKVGVDLLNAPYQTTEEAREAIPAGLAHFYSSNYPDRVGELQGLIDQAATTLLGIYELNFFPEMETDYRARHDNLSHFVNDGCYRCHGADQQTATGETLSADCEICHRIVAQGPSADLADLDNDISGLEFIHPVQIGEAWRQINCTQCHTRASGY